MTREMAQLIYDTLFKGQDFPESLVDEILRVVNDVYPDGHYFARTEFYDRREERSDEALSTGNTIEDLALAIAEEESEKGTTFDLSEEVFYRRRLSDAEEDQLRELVCAKRDLAKKALDLRRRRAEFAQKLATARGVVTRLRNDLEKNRGDLNESAIVRREAEIRQATEAVDALMKEEPR